MMAYAWDHDGTPYVNQQVTYVLSQDECVRFQKDSFASVYPATITFIHTTTCVDLQVTVNGVNLTLPKVTFGNSQRNWYPAQIYGGVTPAGSPY